MQEVKVTAIFYPRNKTRLVSFIVYRRQSGDSFRISGKLLSLLYLSKSKHAISLVFKHHKIILFDSMEG